MSAQRIEENDWRGAALLRSHRELSHRRLETDPATRAIRCPDDTPRRGCAGRLRTARSVPVIEMRFPLRPWLRP
jgi:hypothetical protein